MSVSVFMSMSMLKSEFCQAHLNWKFSTPIFLIVNGYLNAYRAVFVDNVSNLNAYFCQNQRITIKVTFVVNGQFSVIVTPRTAINWHLPELIDPKTAVNE
jgi:hypothetical protein